MPRGPLVLFAVFAALIGINLYFFYFKGGTSLRALLHTTQIHANGEGPRTPPPPPKSSKAAAPTGKTAGPGGSAATPAASPDVVEMPDEGRVTQGTVGASDTLGALLKREGVTPRTAADVAAALGKLFDVRNVRAGHSYTLRWDGEDRLRLVEYRTTPATVYRVERRDEAWRARKETAPIETRAFALAGTVDTTLYEAVKRNGESTALLAHFVDLFASDLDFYVDTHPGDRFRVVVEKQFLDGAFYRYGRVLAAEYAGKAGTFRAFLYQPDPSQAGAYYDERGQSVEKTLLRTPLKFVRISSGFDRHRFHPILHQERAHLGVDYAAPTGTPVWATAGGKVTFRGPKGGAGNCVEIAHPGGMSTVYMHLSRFAKGLAVGDAVRQKQVIGYVGMTGLATGPHLHFSVRMGGHFVDPMRLKAARSSSLAAAERERFGRVVATLRDELAKGDPQKPAQPLGPPGAPSPDGAPDATPIADAPPVAANAAR